MSCRPSCSDTGAREPVARPGPGVGVTRARLRPRTDQLAARLDRAEVPLLGLIERTEATFAANDRQLIGARLRARVREGWVMSRPWIGLVTVPG